MKRTLNILAAELLEYAANELQRHPQYEWTEDERGCCSALGKAYIKIRDKRPCTRLQYLHAINAYVRAQAVFAGMFEHRTRTGYWWPRRDTYREARVLALLFAAAELRSRG